MLRLYLESEFKDRPDLLEKVTPRYTMGAKRFVIDDGLWATTLKQPDVELCTNPIAEITEDGVLTEDGTLHEADVIIYGTGFKASEFLTPMKIVGRKDLTFMNSGMALRRHTSVLLAQIFQIYFLCTARIQTS